MSLNSVQCCHPSDRANEGSDSYVCPTCGTGWARYPFSAAPEGVQRAFRHRDIVPTHFWSTLQADELDAQVPA